MLVGWQMGRVKYKMFTGDKWREGLIRDWQMLHCACMNQLENKIKTHLQGEKYDTWKKKQIVQDRLQ